MTPTEQASLIEYARQIAATAPVPTTDTAARIARIIAVPKAVANGQVAA